MQISINSNTVLRKPESNQIVVKSTTSSPNTSFCLKINQPVAPLPLSNLIPYNLAWYHKLSPWTVAVFEWGHLISVSFEFVLLNIKGFCTKRPCKIILFPRHNPIFCLEWNISSCILWHGICQIEKSHIHLLLSVVYKILYDKFLYVWRMVWNPLK